MSESHVYDVPAEVASRAFITDDQYDEMYERSIADPEGFWAEQAEKFVDWFEKWDKVWEWDYEQASIQWIINTY